MKNEKSIRLCLCHRSVCSLLTCIHEEYHCRNIFRAAAIFPPLVLFSLTGPFENQTGAPLGRPEQTHKPRIFWATRQESSSLLAHEASSCLLLFPHSLSQLYESHLHEKRVADFFTMVWNTLSSRPWFRSGSRSASKTNSVAAVHPTTIRSSMTPIPSKILVRTEARQKHTACWLVCNSRKCRRIGYYR